MPLIETLRTAKVRHMFAWTGANRNRSGKRRAMGERTISLKKLSQSATFCIYRYMRY